MDDPTNKRMKHLVSYLSNKKYLENRSIKTVWKKTIKGVKDIWLFVRTDGHTKNTKDKSVMVYLLNKKIICKIERDRFHNGRTENIHLLHVNTYFPFKKIFPIRKENMAKNSKNGLK